MDLYEAFGVERTPSLDRARELVRADRELMRDLVLARDDAGITQAEVGRRMGISQSAVARIESGRRDLRTSTLRRYAHAVSASIRHIVTPKSQLDAARTSASGLRLVDAKRLPQIDWDTWEAPFERSVVAR